jgi:hypothetical protein
MDLVGTKLRGHVFMLAVSIFTSGQRDTLCPPPIKVLANQGRGFFSTFDPVDRDEHTANRQLCKVRVYRNSRQRNYQQYVSDVGYKDTGNKVSRRATIAGAQNIILGGKTIIANSAIIRGDLRRTGPGHAVVISLGRYCLVGEGCVMRYVLL